MKKRSILSWRESLLLASFALISVLPSSTAVGQGAYMQVPVAQVDNAYRAGYDAYQHEDCAMAIYFFGQYIALAHWSPNRDIAREQLVGQAHSYCVVQLQNALLVKRNLDRYPSITKVTTSSSGRMDGPAVERTIGFQYPQLQYIPKVNLPMPQR